MGEKIRLSQRFYGTLMVLVVCLLVVVLAQNASAAEWDNVKDYDPITRKVTITNILGFGETLAELQLLSPLNVRVGAGYQKVAEFSLDNFKSDYGNAFQDMNFYDLRVGGEEITREFDYKYLTYENILVSDYEMVCTNKSDQNGTDYQDCKQEETGQHWEERERWEKFSDINELTPNTKVIIGIFTEVEVGDYIDWIPTFMGETIEEWATWTGALSVGLVSYWNFDVNSSSQVDSLGLNNGTVTSATYVASCQNNGCYDFEAGDASNEISIPDTNSLDMNGSYTLSAWVKMETLVGSVMDKNYDGGAGSLNYRLLDLSAATETTGFYNGGWREITYSTFNTAQWYHIASTYDGTTLRLYKDGSNVGNLTYSGSPIANGQPLTFGVYYADAAASDWFDGSIDEAAIWNRSLTYDEINIIASGAYYGVYSVAPSVTLTSPVDFANLTSSTVEMIATVTDDQYVENVTLYLDGVANETNSSNVNGTYTFTKIVSEGAHNWSILAYDNATLSNQSSNRTFNYTEPPVNIDLLSPSDLSSHETPTVNMSCIAYKDIGVLQLNLTIDGILNQTVTNSTPGENLSIEELVNFTEGNYTWGCSAYNSISSSTSSNKTFEVLYSNPVIVLFDPSNNSNSTTSNITFTFNATDVNEISNVSLFIDGVLNETNSSGVEGNYSFFKTLTDAVYNWSVTATSILGKITNSTVGVFTVHTTEPVVNVSAPSGRLGYFKIGNNETVIYLVTETGENLTEHLSECWYSYNSVNTSLNCSSANSTFLYVSDINSLTVYANDTFGLIDSDDVTWVYNITEVSQTHPNSSVESATETYTTNITYNNDTFLVITGELTINGTSYTGAVSKSGNTAYLSAIATMPAVEAATNFTAYWTISLTDSAITTDYNLSSNNVSVDLINMSLCGAPYNVSFWNFTILNESNNVEINSTFEGTFTITRTGSTAKNNFSFADTTGTNSQFDFCMYPSTENYTMDTAIKLTKTGFVDKFYNYQDVDVTNSTREDNLYMLATGDSTSFIVHVVYVDSSDAEGAEVQVQRYYEGSGTWATTEILTTNYAGEAVGHLLSEDANYRFLVYQNGVSIYNSTATKITCAVSPCTVTLTIPITVASGIESVGNLVSTLTYSDTTNTFTYTYADSSGDFSRARLYVVRASPSNATIIMPCNTTKATASGVITCDINGQVNGTYVASGYITRTSDEFLDKRIYAAIGTNIYNSMGNDGVLWAFFVFIGIIMLGITRPSLAIIFGTIGLVVLSLVNIINIGALSIVAISAIAIILLMRIGKE